MSYGSTSSTALLVSLATVCLTALPADVATGQEWANLSGRFVYDGDPPVAAKINVNKDPDVCGKFGLKNENIVVGPGGGLASVAIWVRSKKVKVHPDYQKSADSVITFDNKNCRFAPRIQAVRTGQTFRVLNSDTVAHNSQGLCRANPQFNVNLPAGGKHDVVFKKSERLPVPISCSIHPWMKGYLVIQEHPYMAVSSEDGKFSIANLPAGTELEFQVWQEASGYVSDVKSGGKKLPWKRGRFKKKLSPGNNDLGDLLVSPSLFE